MKKLLSLLCLAAFVMLLGSCDPQKNNSQKGDAANFKLADVEDIAMYQVNPRVFAPEKSLNAVAARIDSISALGVNVMWVMPIYPIGEEKSKNSPYSIKDYKAIAPEFGTIDDFKNLVKVCHEHNMGIILDWVANHTAWDHAWVKEHKDWYTQDDKGNIIYPPGTDWTDVADLNYDNKEMRAAMIDAMLFWIKDVGIDGFRCDVADGVPADFWKEAIDTLRAAAGDRKIVMLAEGNKVDNFTVGGFDMNYAWDYMKAMLDVVDKGESVEKLFQTDAAEYDSLPEGKVKLRFTTNHDEATKYSPLTKFGGEEGTMAAYVATVMPRGGALIYGSQEAGYENTINFFNYVPVDWTAHPKVYQNYALITKLYNENAALRKGKLTPFVDKDLMLFEKSDDDARFLVGVNLRKEEKKMNLPADWAKHKGVNIIDGKDYQLEDAITLKPYEYVIVKY